MLPTKKEINKKLYSLAEKYPEDKDMRYREIFQFTQEYAKWYATKIIKHCAEIVTLTDDEIKLLHLIDEL